VQHGSHGPYQGEPGGDSPGGDSPGAGRHGADGSAAEGSAAGGSAAGGSAAGGSAAGGSAAGGLAAGTLEVLRGRWRLERRLTDRASGCRGTFTGVASVLGVGVGVGGTIRYAERGELRFAGHRGPASRDLLLASRRDGAVEVRFADGRPFYRLDLCAGSWHAEHVCGSDLYTVAWQVLGADLLSETWTARGPTKDYELATTLTRLGEDAAPGEPRRARRR
jgi:hypothetical protein